MPASKNYQQTARNAQSLCRSLPAYNRTKSWRNLLPHLIVGGTALGMSVGAFFSYQVISTLLILQHRLKARTERPEIEVIKDYGDLPLVECYAGQLNQVFMNILTNAIDAVEELFRDKLGTACAKSDRTYQEIANNPGQIKISTDFNSQLQVKIVIADNGVGMSETVNQKIFKILDGRCIRTVF